MTRSDSCLHNLIIDANIILDAFKAVSDNIKELIHNYKVKPEESKIKTVDKLPFGEIDPDSYSHIDVASRIPNYNELTDRQRNIAIGTLLMTISPEHVSLGKWKYV